MVFKSSSGSHKGKLYAVKHGRTPGIFSSWDECKAQVLRCPGSVYKSFSNWEAAVLFMAGSHTTSPALASLSAPTAESSQFLHPAVPTPSSVAAIPEHAHAAFPLHPSSLEPSPAPPPRPSSAFHHSTVLASTSHPLGSHDAVHHPAALAVPYTPQHELPSSANHPHFPPPPAMLSSSTASPPDQQLYSLSRAQPTFSVTPQQQLGTPSTPPFPSLIDGWPQDAQQQQLELSQSYHTGSAGPGTLTPSLALELVLTAGDGVPAMCTTCAQNVFGLAFDGAAFGNPGPAGCGAVFSQQDTKREVLRMRQSLPVATNNEAEYAGLVMGLKAALTAGMRHLIVKGDSELVIRQVTGLYRCKSPRLQPFLAMVVQLTHQFSDRPEQTSISFQHTTCDGNQAADQLSKEALDVRESSIAAGFHSMLQPAYC